MKLRQKKRSYTKKRSPTRNELIKYALVTIIIVAILQFFSHNMYLKQIIEAELKAEKKYQSLEGFTYNHQNAEGLTNDNMENDADLQMKIQQQEKEIVKLKQKLGQMEGFYEKNTKNNVNDDDIIAENDDETLSTDIGGYDPNEILYLNVSDSFTLKRKQPTMKVRKDETEYNIDILTIGSVKSTKRANAQMKSWGSHISRRHYWLATEFDDPDPNCQSSLTSEDIVNISYQCRIKGKKFWTKRHAFNKLTSYWRIIFAQDKWLNAKANPSGWLCAQKRFVIALSKLMVIYREGRDKHGIELPDYLILSDDDTYVNMEMVEEELLQKPNKEVQEQQLTLEDELKMVIPTQNTPVVFAGCRVRRPSHIIHDTIPFGGFGVLFSKAAIERLIQPLHCNSTTYGSGFEWEACEHFTPAYSNWTISEYQYFEDGMSVSDLMESYTRNLNPFCLHSDWAIGYFVNHFNISRHVVPTGHLHPGKADDRMYWHNDQMGDVKHSRLHAWDDGSELYMEENGNCRNIGDKCDETMGVCHQMTSESMMNVHSKVRVMFPGKYRNLTA